jgi:hypothetical protein
VLGPEHPNTLTSASNLELVLESQGKHEQADGLVREHCGAEFVFAYQVSAQSNTYIGQASVGISHNETLVGHEETTISNK